MRSLPFVLSVALILAISLSLVGQAVAAAFVQNCDSRVAQGKVAPTPAKAGGCCCCKGSSSNDCSSGFRGGCGAGQREQTSASSPLPNVENLSEGLSQSPNHKSIPTSPHPDDHTTVFGQETVYLINAKLNC
jgi:hypothetical protein